KVDATRGTSDAPGHTEPPQRFGGLFVTPALAQAQQTDPPIVVPPSDTRAPGPSTQAPITPSLPGVQAPAETESPAEWHTYETNLRTSSRVILGTPLLLSRVSACVSIFDSNNLSDLLRDPACVTTTYDIALNTPVAVPYSSFSKNDTQNPVI